VENRSLTTLPVSGAEIAASLARDPPELWDSGIGSNRVNG